MILFTLVPFLDEFSKKKLTDVMAWVWIQPDPTHPTTSAHRGFSLTEKPRCVSC